MNISNAAPLPGDDDREESGPPKEIKWEVVARTSGITQAQIIAGRLRAEGIPVHAWQEGAGEAIGLIVGLLGTGHVSVPEEFAEQARAILAEDVAWEDEPADAEEEE